MLFVGTGSYNDCPSRVLGHLDTQDIENYVEIRYILNVQSCPMMGLPQDTFEQVTKNNEKDFMKNFYLIQNKPLAEHAFEGFFTKNN